MILQSRMPNSLRDRHHDRITAERNSDSGSRELTFKCTVVHPDQTYFCREIKLDYRIRASAIIQQPNHAVPLQLKETVAMKIKMS